MEDNSNTISDNDSVIDIAIKAFNGTATNRKYWSWYYREMALRSGSVPEAETTFLDWVNFVESTLKSDGTPDYYPRTNKKPSMEHVHARAFHRFLRDMFHRHYGDTRKKANGGAQ